MHLQALLAFASRYAGARKTATTPDCLTRVLQRHLPVRAVPGSENPGTPLMGFISKIAPPPTLTTCVHSWKTEAFHGRETPTSLLVPPLPFLTTSAVYSADDLTGLLRPATGHGVRCVSGPKAFPDSANPSKRFPFCQWRTHHCAACTSRRCASTSERPRPQGLDPAESPLRPTHVAACESPMLPWVLPIRGRCHESGLHRRVPKDATAAHRDHPKATAYPPKRADQHDARPNSPHRNCLPKQTADGAASIAGAHKWGGVERLLGVPQTTSRWLVTRNRSCPHPNRTTRRPEGPRALKRYWIGSDPRITRSDTA